MQIKPALKFSLPTVKMATIRETTTHHVSDITRNEPYTLWVGCELVQLLQKSIWRGSKNLQLKLQSEQAVVLVSIRQNQNWHSTVTPVYLCLPWCYPQWPSVVTHSGAHELMDR